MLQPFLSVLQALLCWAEGRVLWAGAHQGLLARGVFKVVLHITLSHLVPQVHPRHVQTNALNEKTVIPQVKRFDPLTSYAADHGQPDVVCTCVEIPFFPSLCVWVRMCVPGRVRMCVPVRACTSWHHNGRCTPHCMSRPPCMAHTSATAMSCHLQLLRLHYRAQTCTRTYTHTSVSHWSVLVGPRNTNLSRYAPAQLICSLQLLRKA